MRPTYGYRQQGKDAYLEGIGVGFCPHRRTEIRACEWRAGWYDAAYQDPFGHDARDDFDSDEDAASYFDRMQVSGDLAAYDLAMRLGVAKAMLPDLAVVAEGFPIDKWIGQCYAVAKHLMDSGLIAPIELEFGSARLAYGMFDGEISDSAIWPRGRIARHGWIEFDSGLVIDPTRWGFTGDEPSIACTTIEGYDLAGRRLIEAIRGDSPPPDFDPSEPQYQWQINDTDLTDLANDLLGAQSQISSSKVFSLSQARYLANRPIEAWGDAAGEFYRFLQNNKLAALIPVDNQNFASEPGSPLSL